MSPNQFWQLTLHWRDYSNPSSPFTVSPPKYLLFAVISPSYTCFHNQPGLSNPIASQIYFHFQLPHQHHNGVDKELWKMIYAFPPADPPDVFHFINISLLAVAYPTPLPRIIDSYSIWLSSSSPVAVHNNWFDKYFLGLVVSNRVRLQSRPSAVLLWLYVPAEGAGVLLGL